MKRLFANKRPRPMRLGAVWMALTVSVVTLLASSVQARYDPRRPYALHRTNLTPHFSTVRELPGDGATPRFRRKFSRSAVALGKAARILYGKKVDMILKSEGAAQNRGKLAFHTFVQMTQRSFRAGAAAADNIRASLKRAGFEVSSINPLEFMRGQPGNRAVQRRGESGLQAAYRRMCTFLRGKKIRWMVVGFVAGTMADFNSSTRLIDTTTCKKVMHSGGYVINGRYEAHPTRAFQRDYLLD